MTTTAGATVSERRQHKRFQTCEEAFAFISNIPFAICNISTGGMNIQTVLFDDIPSEHLILDIFLQNENFYLQDIPVRMVRTKNVCARTPFSSMHLCCLGLQFESLTEQQKTRLDYFIARSSIAAA